MGLGVVSVDSGRFPVGFTIHLRFQWQILSWLLSILVTLDPLEGDMHGQLSPRRYYFRDDILFRL